MGHAFLAPSAAARWGICALSAALEAAYPESESSPESLEGTAAHWVVECVLRGHGLPAIGTQSPNGVAVTQEMQEGAELVLTHVVGTLGPNWQQMLVIERAVPVPAVHPTHCWGTPDYYAWALVDGRRFLFLFDYKFGHGIVEVRENRQLITYTSGLLSEVPDLDDQNTIVCMCIIQPRSFHKDGPVRWWKVRASDLRADVNILHMQAAKATSPNPPATPHPDACEHCNGRHACDALHRAAHLAAAKGQQSQAVDLSPHALGVELVNLTRAQGLLAARVSGLEAQARAEIKAGHLVPFWMLESAEGRLSWTRPDAEVIAMGQMMGKDISKPPEPITPTQAKKAGLPPTLVDAYAARPTGATKLVFDDGSKARLTFGSGNT